MVKYGYTPTLLETKKPCYEGIYSCDKQYIYILHYINQTFNTLHHGKTK
jgi:hypothetical protein